MWRSFSCSFLLVLAACSHHGSSQTTLQRANALLQGGDAAQAYKAYGEGLCVVDASSLDSLELARGLVESWDALGRPASPRQALTCALSAAQASYIDGLTAGAMADWPAAEDALSKALESAPTSWRPDIIGRRAIVALHRGQTRLALDELAEATAQDPTRVDLRLLTAQAQLAAADYAESIETLRGVLALLPTPADLARAERILATAVSESELPLGRADQNTLRDMLSAIERNEVTTNTLSQALDMARANPHPRILSVAGLLALKQGARAEGVHLLDLAQSAAPLDPDPPRILGVHHVAAGETSEAYAPLREAFHRDPFDAEIASLLAPTAVARKDLTLARDAYRTLCALQPVVPGNALGLAQVERQLGHLDAARSAVLAGLALNKQDVTLLYEHAIIEAEAYQQNLSTQGQSEAKRASREAIGALRKVAPQHPGLAALEKAVE